MGKAKLPRAGVGTNTLALIRGLIGVLERQISILDHQDERLKTIEAALWGEPVQPGPKRKTPDCSHLHLVEKRGV